MKHRVLESRGILLWRETTTNLNDSLRRRPITIVFRKKKSVPSAQEAQLKVNINYLRGKGNKNDNLQVIRKKDEQRISPTLPTTPGGIWTRLLLLFFLEPHNFFRNIFKSKLEIDTCGAWRGVKLRTSSERSRGSQHWESKTLLIFVPEQTHFQKPQQFGVLVIYYYFFYRRTFLTETYTKSK